MDHIVVDVEIQKCIGGEIGWNDTHLLGVGCAVVYEYLSDRFRVYGHQDLQELRDRILQADRVSGFNTFNFDFPVIFGFQKNDWVTPSPEVARIKETLGEKSNDILRRIWVALGLNPDKFVPQTHGGYSLDVVSKGTLRANGKIANGAIAPVWYQAGEFGKLINYCVDDVALERDLTNFVDKFGFIVGKNGNVVRL